MGVAHQAVGLPSFDYHESDVYHLHSVDVRRGLVGGLDRARRTLGETTEQAGPGLVAAVEA